MGDTVEAFDEWLFERLRALNTDETVFGPYIKSIVDGDEDDAEKVEGLDGLLLELVPEMEVPKLRDEILKRWASYTNAATGSTDSKILDQGNGMNGQLETIIGGIIGNSGSEKTSSNTQDGKHSLSSQMDTFLRLSGLDGKDSGDNSETTKARSANKVGAGAVDSELRAAILSQCCANDSDSDEEEDVQGSAGTRPGKSVDISLPKNANAEKVLAEQRDAKEKSRAEHAKKKEKDKDDRVKQKKAAEDRKEKAKKKAQKTERKR